MKVFRLQLAASCALVFLLGVCADDKSENAVVYLNEKNFEHLTQAATGGTTGDWMVLFCERTEPRCKRVEKIWEEVASALTTDREAEGLLRVNVARVNTERSKWLAKRFGITNVPLVLFFRHGMMYLFSGRTYTKENLIKFGAGGYETAARHQVPPEPHVADDHEATFLYGIGMVAVGSGVLWVIDSIFNAERKKNL